MSKWLRFGTLLIGIASLGASLAAADDSAALKERARQFWDARVKGDWNTVYDIMPPQEQAVVKREDFVAYQGTGGPFKYLAAEIGDITIDKPIAWVAVTFTVQARQYPGVPPREVKTWDLWQLLDDGWRPVPKQALDQWPRRPPQARPAEEEAALGQRVDAAWKAREANDWKAVYELLDPTYRKTVVEEQFLARRAQLLYLGHRVEWVEVTEDRGRVKIAFDYRYNDPSMSKMEPRSANDIEEWVKMDGQWFRDMRKYVEQESR